MYVKICGLTNLKDAQAAVQWGASALGFIFAPSPRKVDPKKVCEITRKLGPFVSMVGVFVNAGAEQILKTASEARLDVIQLHGEESPELCRKLSPYKVIKTFRPGELFSPKDITRFDVDACLFETPGKVKGGSGRTWAWEKFPRKKIKKPMIVSGGLTVRNVKRAIQVLSPYAVDVSSSIESQAGIKDHKLMKEFIQNAKS